MGPREIVIILVIVILLFGAPKLPELARSIGKSMKILKDETKSLTSDDDKAEGSSDGRTDAEQAQQRGDKAVPDSTVELPDDEARDK